MVVGPGGGFQTRGKPGARGVQPCGVRVRSKVGRDSGEIELGGGLMAADVPRLPQTQLRQLGLAEVAIGCDSHTELEIRAAPNKASSAAD